MKMFATFIAFMAVPRFLLEALLYAKEQSIILTVAFLTKSRPELSYREPSELLLNELFLKEMLEYLLQM